MPALVDGSVKNAQLVLDSYGLELGNIKYVPDSGAECGAGTTIRRTGYLAWQYDLQRQ